MAKAPKKSMKYASGLSESAIARLIQDAQELDQGTARHPWPTKLERRLKVDLLDCRDMAELRAKINEIVVKELGGHRGPFA